MAWLAHVIGTGARGTKSQLSCQFVHLSNATIPSKSKIVMRSIHFAQRRHWIHSSSKLNSGQTTSPPLSTTGANSTVDILKNNATVYPAKRPRLGRPTYNWTPEQDAKILELRLQGNVWQEIGEALNMPYIAVRQRYMKHLDPALHRGWDPARLERLNTVVAEGKSWRRISEEFSMPQPACREKWMSINPHLMKKTAEVKLRKRRSPGKGRPNLFKDNGFVVARARRWTDQIDAILLDFRNRGLSWKQIGSIFVMTPMTCFTRFNYLTKTKLKSGWVSPKIKLPNSPAYLLSNRRPSSMGELTSIGDNSVIEDSSSSAALAESQNEQSETLDASINNLGIVSEDISYDVYDSYPPRAWTKDEDDYILNSRIVQIPFNSIGSYLDLDPRQCYERYYTVLDPALKDKEWTPKLTEKLLFYISQGLSWTTIAYALGFHRTVCMKKYKEIRGSSLQKYPADGATQRARDNSSAAAAELIGEEEEEEEQYQGEHEGAEGEYFEDNDDNHGDDIIDDLHGDVNDDDALYDTDGNDDDGGDDTLDSSSSYHSEGFTDDPIPTGRRSKKQKSTETVSTTLKDMWDQESLLREIRKTWTPEEETALIRHVIRNGTRGWYEISNTLNGRHSADECRAYWKYLDMPLRGYRPQVRKWEPHHEAQFWRLWLEHGSNFEDISERLANSDISDISGKGVSSLNTNQQSLRRFSPQDCEKLFTQRTQRLTRESDEKEADWFQKKCVQLALTRSKSPSFIWNKKSSVKLQKLVLQRLRTRGVHVNWVNWKWVARHIGGDVSAMRCSIHWRALRVIEMQRADWTDDDILLLEQGLREVGSIFNDEMDDPSLLLPPDQESDDCVEPSREGFRAIQKFYLPHKSVDSLQRKFFLLSDKASRVTVREYMAIMDAVDKFGEDQWDKVVESLKSPSSHDSSVPSPASSEATLAKEPPNLVGWTKAPCRRVWESSYKYQLLHTKWTPEEDIDLGITVDRIGQSDWISVSRFFPGKSAWQCRLRWCQMTDPTRSA
ncbi:hypothetical protein BGX27_005794 [Mortierella sp. AM989]|nr:hypothetical protein BGX27_005794 [Mortierella sp. AM989]